MESEVTSPGTPVQSTEHQPTVKIVRVIVAATSRIGYQVKEKLAIGASKHQFIMRNPMSDGYSQNEIEQPVVQSLISSNSGLNLNKYPSG